MDTGFKKLKTYGSDLKVFQNKVITLTMVKLEQYLTSFANKLSSSEFFNAPCMCFYESLYIKINMVPMYLCV